MERDVKKIGDQGQVLSLLFLGNLSPDLFTVLYTSLSASVADDNFFRKNLLVKADDDDRERFEQASQQLVPLAERLSLSVGLGAGTDHASVETQLVDGPVSSDAWRFAYQGLVGLNIDVSARLSLFANYRYLHVGEGSFAPEAGLGLDTETQETHTASLGLRFFLDAAAPPPPPEPLPPMLPPAPEPREFLVFFRFNNATLTAAALATVQQAATAATQLGTANIRIVGHADRAGSPAYNKALSLRRAQAVRKVMVREGVMASAIMLRGVGESEPLVPTADGVREPQNRRVQITF